MCPPPLGPGKPQNSLGLIGLKLVSVDISDIFIVDLCTAQPQGRTLKTNVNFLPRLVLTLWHDYSLQIHSH